MAEPLDSAVNMRNVSQNESGHANAPLESRVYTPVTLREPRIAPPGLAPIRIDNLRTGPRYAALDLGTNNCRLLIARPEGASFRVVDSFSRIVRLGEGVSLTKRLNDDAMARTMEALTVCRRKINDRGVVRARMVATEACRAAINGLDFLNRVGDELGLAFEILGPNAEAALAASGCATLADPKAKGVLLFDIGGGSTELVWLSVAGYETASIEERMRTWISVPIGVVTLAEKYGGGEISLATFEAMVADVLNAIEPFVKESAGAAEERGFHLLGTSGTVTTLGGFILNLDYYDRRKVDGLWISSTEVDIALRLLQRMSYAERAAHGCIGKERAEFVLAGCAIFEAIRRAFPSSRVRIGDRGLREGMLLTMMQQDGVFASA
jgi:exopolyphosphatase / guanosine-5'-triphosphate,3'-diphosphate pyrophosphatase